MSGLVRAEGPKPILYGDAARWGLVQADSLHLLPQLPDQSVDAICTDPPYAIDFAGAAWDGRTIDEAVDARGQGLSRGQAFQAWTTLWATDAKRVVRPGGYLTAFAAPRTFHRLTAGLEDAGFEIRDVASWLYGSGMPKSRRLQGDRDRGTALKPAWEPIVIARKKPEGTIEQNLAAHGTGALNIGEARVIDPDEHAAGQAVGRWPANVAWSHLPDCSRTRCARGCPGPLLDQGQANRPSRFFYAAKASTTEREAGCEQLPLRDAAVFSKKKGTPGVRRRNHHPTAKPAAQSLMAWLVRLTCPAGGVVLDPFAGSGSTGIAALLEGRRFMGVERDPAFTEVAVARLTHWAAIAAQQAALSEGPDRSA